MENSAFALMCQPLITKARQPLNIQVDAAFFADSRRDTDMRILSFDPAPVYERLGGKINAFSRSNFNFGMEHIFPTVEPGVCACGCGVKITGRRNRYATPECSRFCNYIYNILAGKVPTINYFMTAIAGGNYSCMDCGEVTTWETAVKKKHSYDSEITHEIDHIVPVILGGGGCWLGNYQQICVTCHIKKSKRDKNDRAVKIKQALATHNPELF
jgi:5-methylcytosine-specific restriction endonuclease McrA